MAKAQPKPDIETVAAFDAQAEAAQVIEDSTRPDAEASPIVVSPPAQGYDQGPGVRLNKDGTPRKKRTSKFDRFDQAPQNIQPVMTHHMSAAMFNGILAMVTIAALGEEAQFTVDEKKAIDAALGDYLKYKNIVAPPGAILASTYAVVLLGKLQKPTVRERVFTWLEKTKARFSTLIKRGQK